MTDDLQKIIDRAYKVFDGYKVAKPLDVCTVCCVTDEEVDQLVNLDVRKLPQKLLYTWNHAAKTHHPNLSEFKHYLPRFLDFIAQFEWPSHSVELTLKSFGYYTASDWTKQEKELIGDFGWVFFQHCLCTFPIPNVSSLDSVIIMLSSAGVDIDPLLLEWEKSSNRESIMHFADFAIDGADLGNPFLELEPELQEKLSLWLHKEGVISNFSKRVEDLILNHRDLDDADRSHLSWAYDHIQFLPRTHGAK